MKQAEGPGVARGKKKFEKNYLKNNVEKKFEKNLF